MRILTRHPSSRTWSACTAIHNASGRLDVTIQDPVTRLKEHCEDLKDLITDLRVDISYLQGLCDDYERILKEHGLL